MTRYPSTISNLQDMTLLFDIEVERYDIDIRYRRDAVHPLLFLYAPAARRRGVVVDRAARASAVVAEEGPARARRPGVRGRGG